MARLITQHWAVVYNAYCTPNSRTRVTARTREELWVKIYDGQQRGVLGDVIMTGDEQIPDPDELKAERAELERITRTTCPMPSEDDLRKIIDAKAVDPTDWDAIMAIDQVEVYDRRVRARLGQIKMDKMNQYWKHTP